MTLPMLESVASMTLPMLELVLFMISDNKGVKSITLRVMYLGVIYFEGSIILDRPSLSDESETKLRNKERYDGSGIWILDMNSIIF